MSSAPHLRAGGRVSSPNNPIACSSPIRRRSFTLLPARNRVHQRPKRSRRYPPSLFAMHNGLWRTQRGLLTPTGFSPGIHGRVCRSAMSSTVCARASYVSATLRMFDLASAHMIDAAMTSPNDSSGADGASAEPGMGEDCGSEVVRESLVSR